MAPKTTRFCPACNKHTEQVHYDDYRPGKPYEYYQCTRCGDCWYMCNVHRRFEADISLPNQRRGECACYERIDDEAALADAKREMFGDDADLLPDDMGAQ